MRTIGCAVIGSLLILTGCMTTSGERSFNLISSEEESQIGAKIAKEVEQKEKVLNDPALQAYVQNVGQRVSAMAERRDVTYQFKVIDAPDTVNAFALPGGYMYVYTGLMKICDNEAELASVMAHEIAHVSSYHHGEALTRAYGVQLISSLLLGENSGQLARIASDFIGQTGMMYFSRQNEYEADAKGMDYLFRAGYRPEAMAAFMQKLANQEGQAGRGPMIKLFSTHPPSADRLARLNAQLQQYPADLREKNTDYAERYTKEAISRLK
ncbi:MAG TPA: M48 family metallopeptidase [Candidatus Hydrogenedentes bacterium]|nr:M48 family metallopeptidase [Candidatus Hydrogenedentota bacterium]